MNPVSYTHLDATQTMALPTGDGTTEVQVVSWYDNENSYTSQMVRTIKYFGKLLEMCIRDRARIEEMVEKAQKEVDTMIREEGEAAALEVGVPGIHPELIRLLGRDVYKRQVYYRGM